MKRTAKVKKTRMLGAEGGVEVWTLPVPDSKTITKAIHVEVNHSPPGGAPPEWALSLKAELGMPTDAIWRRLVMDGVPLGERWRDYHLEVFGMVVEPSLPSDYPWPFWLISDQSGSVKETVQVWRLLVTHASSPLYCEALCHPVRGKTVSIRGLEKPHSATDLSFAWRGIELLESLVLRGRPPGADLTQEEFLDRAPIACRKWMDQFDGKCNDLNLAESLRIGTSTLYSYMKRYKFPLKSIREEAIKLKPPLV